MIDELNELPLLTPKKKLLSNVLGAAVIIAAGIFLLLCAVGVIKVNINKVICGTLLFAVGTVFLICAVIGRNSVTLWLSFCFLVPSLVELLVNVTELGYKQLYPLYVAIPAAASAVTMFFTRRWAAHLCVIALFGVPAAILGLSAGGVASWQTVGAALVIYIGVLMLAITLKPKKKDEEDEH